jgi:hypothetical protein
LALLNPLVEKKRQLEVISLWLRHLLYPLLVVVGQVERGVVAVNWEDAVVLS